MSDLPDSIFCKDEYEQGFTTAYLEFSKLKTLNGIKVRVDVSDGWGGAYVDLTKEETKKLRDSLNEFLEKEDV